MSSAAARTARLRCARVPARLYSSRPPPPPRRTPPPPPPPPRRDAVSLPSQAKTAQPAVIDGMLGGGERGSMLWNLGYLFLGLGFAGWVFAQVPRQGHVQRSRPGDGVPKLPSTAKIRTYQLDRITSTCLRLCFSFFRETLRSDRRHLQEAILSVPAVSVKGVGLERALEELLGAVESEEGEPGNHHFDTDEGVGLDREYFEGALRAAILSAELLSSAGLVSLEVRPAADDTENGSAGWEGQGQVLQASPGLRVAQSVLVVCLVARACGAQDEEIMRYIVEPLEFHEGGERLPDLLIPLLTTPAAPHLEGDSGIRV